MSGKVHVDRILAGEARIDLSGKSLVFFIPCLVLFFLKFLDDSFFFFRSVLG